ncbi:MAG: UDP-N-acetylmuramate dehydrogenase [Bacteroidales bacterium]|nr:UDP-N-acetylmuramate dehydrogenase [Bacteroidales bacterium]
MIHKLAHYDLTTRNTFRMKVNCALYVEITEEHDLESLDWDALPKPFMVLGGGSNLLFTGDFPGTVLHVAITGCHSERSEESVLTTAGAGVVFDDFCAWTASRNLWGPENLSLIPGEVGASAVQNIGAYGVEAKDIIAGIRAWDLQERKFVDIDPADCQYGYRTSRFKTEWKGRFVITAVTYKLSKEPKPVLDYGGVRKALQDRSFLANAPQDDKNAVCQSITPAIIRDTIIAIRRKKLPDPEEIGSAGSFFCNPVISKEHFAEIVKTAKADNGPDYEVPHYVVGDMIKVPAAWMIEQCGFKGATNGGAQVYRNQPLVIVNASGHASPEEIIGLEQRIIDTIATKYGITLHPEVEHV